MRDEVPDGGIAEEARDVDQDRVEELRELVRMLVEIRLVVGIRLDPERLHALGETAGETRPLVAAVVEASSLPDVVEQLLEGRRALVGGGRHASAASGGSSASSACGASRFSRIARRTCAWSSASSARRSSRAGRVGLDPAARAASR